MVRSPLHPYVKRVKIVKTSTMRSARAGYGHFQTGSGKRWIGRNSSGSALSNLPESQVLESSLDPGFCNQYIENEVLESAVAFSVLVRLDIS